MNEVKIFFKDLSKEKQIELLEVFMLDNPEDMNWDIFPVAIITFNINTIGGNGQVN